LFLTGTAGSSKSGPFGLIASPFELPCQENVISDNIDSIASPRCTHTDSLSRKLQKLVYVDNGMYMALDGASVNVICDWVVSDSGKEARKR
jgi:hypothetical protein